MKSKHPKGLVGVVTGEIGRYRMFDIALNSLQMPEGSHILWAMGIDIPGNNNTILQETLEKDYQWAWLLGDDHMFRKDLLLKLLDRNVDVVVPLCARRHLPFSPVIHNSIDQGATAKDWDFLDGKAGLLELTDHNVGNGCMFIRREVIEKIPSPWFENGKYNAGTGHDLWFCEKIKKAGFKLHVDLDNLTGHITPSVIMPTCDNGKWTYRINTL